MSIDLTAAWKQIQSLINAIIAALPNLALAAIVLTIFIVVARFVRRGVVGLTERRHRNRGLAVLLGRLSNAAILVVGVLASLSVVLPTFKASDLIQILGVGGLAIGFAFKDIFENFLAGILILVSRPFRIGDQIELGDFKGTVEDIQTRATLIKTFDNRRIVIPNSQLFTQSVVVNTAYPMRRTEYEVMIGYDDDLDRAKQVILDTLATVDVIEKDPPPDALLMKLDPSGAVIRLRWWTRPDNIDLVRAQDRVLDTLYPALVQAGITLSNPTQIQLVDSDLSVTHDEELVTSPEKKS